MTIFAGGIRAASNEDGLSFQLKDAHEGSTWSLKEYSCKPFAQLDKLLEAKKKTMLQQGGFFPVIFLPYSFLKARDEELFGSGLLFCCILTFGWYFQGFLTNKSQFRTW